MNQVKLRLPLLALLCVLLPACDATSPDRTPVRVEIEGGPEVQTVVGAVIPLRAEAKASDGRVVAPAAPLIWTSSDTLRATVDENGVVRTKNPGTPKIIVRMGADASAPADTVRVIIVRAL